MGDSSHVHELIWNDGATKSKKQYGPTTIAPCELKPYTHLSRSVINEAISKVNEAVYILFK